MADPVKKGASIHITGIVQGVGFRPFVYNLATELSLQGWVRNTSAGVDISVEGPAGKLHVFTRRILEDAPPLSRIDDLQVVEKAVNHFHKFEILESEEISGAFQPISPDTSICPDCLNELFTPGDRRYLYPFINCTNCGPRFTIIQDIPYDRPKTTMAGFPMCPACKAEYHDPADRRFHAQPVACPVCGPHVWIEHPHDPVLVHAASINDRDSIRQAQQFLREGKILAVKGLGGFHLACDASNPEAVAILRQRKLRVDKPFALMMPDISAVENHCFLSATDRFLLTSRERPIVLVERKPRTSIDPAVAPNQNTLGVMLPYTPLHYLLFHRFENSDPIPVQVLVMTSGNLSEEPIATENAEARERLKNLADVFLMHDRPIHIRCDDSVVRAAVDSEPQSQAGMHHLPEPLVTPSFKVMPLRRSRGYAPFPVQLPWEVPPLIAAGAEIKNTFCVTRQRYAILSQHIGDMENYETLRSFEEGIQHFERLFRIQPAGFAYDLHPNYLATRYILERAQREGLPAIGVQHHHAHICACMIENHLPGDSPVLGIAFDGTGYGEDGTIWGGEFLLADYNSYRRLGHLRSLPLPGGDAAVRKPARIALAYLWQYGMEWDDFLESVKDLCVEERTALRGQLMHQINTPLTSSAGRLFDAVAALAGIRQTVNYEAQAAIELEACLDTTQDGAYPFEILTPTQTGDGIQINPGPMLQALIEDRYRNLPVPSISAKFHRGLCTAVTQAVLAMRNEFAFKDVVLSGGVWQNRTFLHQTLHALSQAGFQVFTHCQVPTNDGGLALGQAAVAGWKINHAHISA